MNCSEYFTHPNASSDCKISFRFGPSLIQIAYSLLVPGDVIDISGVLYQVPQPPTPYIPFFTLVSGPVQVVLPGRRVCWGVKSFFSGGKGVTYTLESEDDGLSEVMEFTRKGWLGAGRGEYCIEEEDWDTLEGGRTYTFQVTAESVLFGTSDTDTFSFLLSSSSSSVTKRSSRSSRQTVNCDPDLWDSSPSSIFAIETFPSMNTILPPTLRSTPLTVTAKVVSPCSDVGGSKDILPPSALSWTIQDPIPSGLDGVDANDWANGTSMVIPASVLKNRASFPSNEPVRIRVTADFGEGVTQFIAETSIQFLAAPVQFVTDPAVRYVIDAQETLIIDFKESYTDDGIVFGEGDWVWEWEWECFIPTIVEGGEETVGRPCEYEGGNVIEMPGSGEQRFEGEEGERFEVGLPLLFVVRTIVRDEEGGEVVSEGTWEKLFSPVEEEGLVLEFVEESWMCSDASVGYSVSFLPFFSLLFFTS